MAKLKTRRIKCGDYGKIVALWPGTKLLIIINTYPT